MAATVPAPAPERAAEPAPARAIVQSVPGVVAIPDAATRPAQEATAAGAAGHPGGVAGNDSGNGAVPDSVGSLGVDSAGRLADNPAAGASAGGATRSGGDVGQPEQASPVTPKPASKVRPVAARTKQGAEVGHATYQLQIKPWGSVYVDGVERGASPPVRRLVLTPGHHTIRITNPKYRDSILEFDSAPTTSNGKIIVDFEHEPQ